MSAASRFGWLLGGMGTLFLASPVLAGEGGASNYLQGTYGDFQSGIFGPPGLYYRDDLFFYDASIGARPLGGRVAIGVDQKVWGNLSKFSYLTNFKILGARVGTAIAIPVVLNASVSGTGSTNVLGIVLSLRIRRKRMFLVMGITGKVGSATAKHLLAQGKEVRALVRNREKAANWANQGVELVDGDWNDFGSHRASAQRRRRRVRHVAGCLGALARLQRSKGRDCKLC